MNSESPYYVTTNSGKLQLTKGSYLTLMKRKNSVAKTLQKSKPIYHSYKQSKRTLKKSSQFYKEKFYSLNKDTVIMTTVKNSKMIERQFVVRPDKQALNFAMIPNVPIIEMEFDNDCDSEWPQIYDCVNHLSMSLSLAMHDRMIQSASYN